MNSLKNYSVQDTYPGAEGYAASYPPIDSGASRSLLWSSIRYLLLVIAPFAGAIVTLFFIMNWDMDLTNEASLPELEINLQEPTREITVLMREAANHFVYTQSAISQIYDNYLESATKAEQMARNAGGMKLRPLIVYDRRVIAKLGTPTQRIRSDKLELDIYPLKEPNYQGYAMKVNLRSPDAMKMVLGYDKLGEGETTLSAAKRYGAVAAVNAGGFADDGRTGKRYPLSTTMMNGNYLFGFEPSFSDLFFVGLNDQGKLIGGKFSNKEELEQHNPVFGASFVPILLKNGVAQPIPKKWQTSPRRAARTVIANYKHDHLLFLVINGNDGNGSYGATLAELQKKLKELGVVDAYNLDGGGSTSLVVKDKVLNKPTDGKLRPLATHFLFFE